MGKVLETAKRNWLDSTLDDKEYFNKARKIMNEAPSQYLVMKDQEQAEVEKKKREADREKREAERKEAEAEKRKEMLKSSGDRNLKDTQNFLKEKLGENNQTDDKKAKSIPLWHWLLFFGFFGTLFYPCFHLCFFPMG